MPPRRSSPARHRRQGIRLAAVRLATLAVALAGLALPRVAAFADEVGSFNNDWTGNGLVVEAVSDPDVQGVTCHIVSFSRGVIDRLRKGNWFEDPSNTSIACRQTGPIVVGRIDTSPHGEEVFSERKSLIFKSIAVRRLYDKANDTLVYVIYSRQVKDASAKMAISTVPLYGTGATWTRGKPAR